MAYQYNSPIHQREATIGRRRFAAIAAVFVMGIAVTAGLVVQNRYGTHAAALALIGAPQGSSCTYNQASKNPVQTGETFTARVILANTGSSVWSSTQYANSLQEYAPDGVQHWTVVSGNLIPPDYIYPGQSADFTITVRAPATAGTYGFNWGIFVLYQGIVNSPCYGTVTVKAPPAPTPPPTPPVTPPTVTPKPPSTPPTAPKPPATPPTSPSKPATSPSSPASPSAAPADTLPPTAPTNFSATASPTGVDLGWSASVDNIAVAGYALERSTDNKNWSQLNSRITQTVYTDSTTSYATKYYYRVKGFDAAGNASAFVVTSVSTPDFSANTQSSGDTTLLSDDGKVKVVIPAGATGDSAVCTVESNLETLDKPTVKSLTLAAGPYALICKKANGDTLDHLSSAATYTVGLTKAESSKYGKLYIFGYDTGNSSWIQIKTAKYDKKTNTYSISSDQPLQFAVMGSKKAAFPWMVLWTLLFVLAIIGGVFFFILRSQQKSKYNDYIRKKYYNL